MKENLRYEGGARTWGGPEGRGGSLTCTFWRLSDLSAV